MRKATIVLASLVFTLASVPAVSAAPPPSCPFGTTAVGGQTVAATEAGPFFWRLASDGAKELWEETNGYDGLQETARTCVDAFGVTTPLYGADKRIASTPAGGALCVPTTYVCLL